MTFRRIALLCVLCISSASSAFAQYHAECWYRLKSSYRITGAQPSSAEIWTTMKALSVKYGIPVEVVAAVSWGESGWRQFASDGYVAHNRTSCTNLYRNSSSYPNPPDVGMMQLAGSTAKNFDVQTIISSYAANLEGGIKVLLGKWKTYYTYTGPKYYPGRPFDHDKMVLENWYYPLKAYNGWASLSDFSYVERAYGYMESPGSTPAKYVFPVRVTRPGEAIPGFTLPPAPGKYLTYFKAWAPGNRIMDGTYANHYAKPTHRGTFGESSPTPIPNTVMRCTAATLNVRKGPGTEWPIVGKIALGQRYVANLTGRGWHRVMFNRDYGWCQSASLAKTTGVTAAKLTGGDLGVYALASSASTRLGAARDNFIYVRVAADTTYYRKIEWGGTSGWLAKKYTMLVTF